MLKGSLGESGGGSVDIFLLEQAGWGDGNPEASFRRGRGAAGLADPVDDDLLALEIEIGVGFDFIENIGGIVGEDENTAANPADKMGMVAAVRIGEFVAGRLTGVKYPHETHFGDHFGEIAINGALADPGVDTAGFEKDLIEAKGTVGPLENLEDGLALAGVAAGGGHKVGMNETF